MKNLLEYILIHLVEHPEEVSIVEEPGERGTTFSFMSILMTSAG